MKKVESTSPKPHDKAQPPAGKDQKSKPIVKNVQKLVPMRTNIAARLDEAIKIADKKNRSSDLVPLNHEFELMRKQLKALIEGAKNYHAAVVKLDQTRMKMVESFSALADKTPLYNPTGIPTGHEDSLLKVHQDASRETATAAKTFQTDVIDYGIEWEQIVTERVEKESKQVGKLHGKLNHYQEKVESLRKAARAREEKGKVPRKLEEKLQRNEDKLSNAWKFHEKAASNLCNLLEGVTKQGWKDLYPVLKSFMTWTAKRAASEYDVFARLPVVEEFMTETYISVVEQNEIPGMTQNEDQYDSYSDTTGSYHPDEEESVDNSLGNAEDHNIPPSPTRIKKSDHITPSSPTAVVHT